MASQRFIQLLRSSSIYNSFADAKAALEGLTGRKDGEIVLARYNSTRPGAQDGTTVPYVDSAIGVYRVTDSPAASYCTVFQSSEEVEKLIAEVQAELDATQAGAGLGDEGAYTAPVSGQPGFEVLGGQGAPGSLYAAIMALADAIAAMDHTKNYTAASGEEPNVVPAHATDASKVISGVNQANGVLDTVTTDAVDLLLTGYANDGTTHTGAISASDTVETALNKLENATSAGVQLSEKSGNQITRITGESTAANNGLYSHVEIAKLTDQEVTALGNANVREAYKLIDANGRTAIGDVIKIYKDSSLQSVYLGHVDDKLANEDSTTHESADTAVTSGTGSEALCFIYHLENGNYKLVAVDLESFLQESEFGDGLQVNNHVVSVNAGDGLDFDSSDPKKVIVKKDSNSEQVYTNASTNADVLTVGANGVKVANVQAAINYATDQVLDTTVTSNAEALNSNNDKHIVINESTAANGLHSYAITEQDIASEDQVNALTGQTLGSAFSASGNFIGFSTDITDALEDLDAAVGDSLDEVIGSNAIEVSAKTAADAQQNPRTQTVSLILDDSTVGTGTELTGNYNALSVTNDGLFLSNIWDCGTY